MKIKIFVVVLLAAFTLQLKKANAFNITAAPYQVKLPPPPPAPPPPPRLHIRTTFRHHPHVMSPHRLKLHRPPPPPGLPPAPQ